MLDLLDKIRVLSLVLSMIFVFLTILVNLIHIRKENSLSKITNYINVILVVSLFVSKVLLKIGIDNFGLVFFYFVFLIILSNIAIFLMNKYKSDYSFLAISVVIVILVCFMAIPSKKQDKEVNKNNDDITSIRILEEEKNAF